MLYKRTKKYKKTEKQNCKKIFQHIILTFL